MSAAMAYQARPGDRVTVNGSEVVTVAAVTRRDSSWVSNGVVYFRATDGPTYGVDRYHPLEPRPCEHDNGLEEIEGVEVCEMCGVTVEPHA